MSKDIHSLSHTRWNCKYHVVFAPKYRRKVFYGEKRLEIGAILRELCNWKGVNIIQAEVCIDHVHMLIEIPPKMSVSSFMGFLKGKSSIMIYEKWGNLKYKYRGRQFWCRGYYVDTAGKNDKIIKEYIAKQLKEDELGEQLTFDVSDPFKGQQLKFANVRLQKIPFEVLLVNKALTAENEEPPARLVDFFLQKKKTSKKNKKKYNLS